MVKDLTRLLGNFFLSAKEGNELKITNQKLTSLSMRGKSCLVGKLIAKRIIGKESIRKTLIKGWRPSLFSLLQSLGRQPFHN
jgi:hypothetical protein